MWRLKMILLCLSQMITLGGDAELELVDSLDPFSEGVVFSVRPPKKSWKNIANLSGGEKVSVKSVAVVFVCYCIIQARNLFSINNVICRPSAHWLLFLHSITINPLRSM